MQLFSLNGEMIAFDIPLISLYCGALGSAAKIVRGLCNVLQ